MFKRSATTNVAGESQAPSAPVAGIRGGVPAAIAVIAGYGFAGAVFAGLWMWHSTDPLWEEAARLLTLLAIVTVLSSIRHKRAAKQDAKAPTPLGRFIIAKLALVIVAVIATLLLEQTTLNAGMWVAVGMATMVSVVGPAIHPWLSHSSRQVRCVARR
ncbi:hypothetical protein A5641_10325 [Mycobacterium sp. 1554424.7]|nr:hypothetical protein A5641_10325 [Mycobacterium sp. 1554424.7]